MPEASSELLNHSREGEEERERERRALRIGAFGGVMRLHFTGLSGVVVLRVAGIVDLEAGVFSKTVAQNVTNDNSLSKMVDGVLRSTRSANSEYDRELQREHHGHLSMLLFKDPCIMSRHMH